MAKYLIEARYTAEGAKGLLAEGGSSRRKAVETAVKKLGAAVECFYFALGDRDLIIIADVPDPVDAIAMNLQVTASGAATTSTTRLLTAEELDQATARAVPYRPATG